LGVNRTWRSTWYAKKDFAQLLKDSEVAYNVRIAAEKKAEEDRIAKEKAEKEEQERIKAENEKLKKKLEAEKAEAERKLKEKEEAEAKAAKEKAEAEEKARKEAEAEQEKLAKASDTDKIAKLIKDIEAISFPEVKSHKAKQVIADIKSKLGQFKELLGQI
jgi:septal ring factor EnvC (AmiA/AmiB activator)